MIRLLALVLCVLIAADAAAGDAKYRPVNPNFGGSPFNGDFLLGQAQLQNQYEAPERDPLDDFDRDLTRRLLSRAAGEIEDRIFGENPEDSGVIPLNDFEIRFERIGSIIELTIIDLASGGATKIEIPAPGF